MTGHKDSGYFISTAHDLLLRLPSRPSSLSGREHAAREAPDVAKNLASIYNAGFDAGRNSGKAEWEEERSLWRERHEQQTDAALAYAAEEEHLRAVVDIARARCRDAVPQWAPELRAALAELDAYAEKRKGKKP